VSAAPSVTVVGGGLAGMSAALRLAERGYRVKLYEQKGMLGGNLATRKLRTGGAYDVYPHMYLGWYGNFWQMMEEVGVERDAHFAPFSTVRQLGLDEFPSFTELIDGYGIRQLLENLRSGWASPQDMVVFGYAAIDLLAEKLNPTVRWHKMSLSGFLDSRPYMTDGAEAAYDTFVTRIWGIPASIVSAKDFRTYLSYCFAEPEPVFWLTRGPAQAEVIGPLEVALKRAGVKIECGVEVTSVTRTGERVSAVTLRRTKFNPRHYRWEATGEAWREAVDELILAVPATTLASLVRSATRGERIIEVEESLSWLSRLRTERVPILHACFKQTLEDLPPEPVGLRGSRLNVAFTDISQTWRGVPEFSGRSVCAVSCSDVGGLSGATPTENGHQVLAELAEYLKFDAGAAWGKSPVIDWGLTRYDENYDAELSLNAVGTDAMRPPASFPGVCNLALAGDFCRGHIGLTTIESAVASGLNAVNAVVRRRGVGDEARVQRPPRRPDAQFVAYRYALAPYVIGAKAFSTGAEGLRGERPRHGKPSVAGAQGGGADGESLVRYLLTPGLPARHQRFES
jgi:uncharacterized protein with NAD-binding domain and iron-sulfur cluster